MKLKSFENIQVFMYVLVPDRQHLESTAFDRPSAGLRDIALVRVHFFAHEMCTCGYAHTSTNR